MIVAHASAGNRGGGRVGLARFEAQQLRVLVRDDVDDHAIEIRQRRAAGVVPPVVLVAGEDEPLARQIFAEHERSGADELRRRRRQAQRFLDRAVRERRFELVERQHRNEG